MLGAYFYSAGTQLGNQRQSSVTKSSVTYFSLRAHAGPCNSHSNAEKKKKKNSEEVLEEKREEDDNKWTRKVEISSRKKSLAVSEACVAIF